MAEKNLPSSIVSNTPDICEVALQLCEHVESLEARLKVLEEREYRRDPQKVLVSESFDAGIMKIVADACEIDISDVTYETRFDPNMVLTQIEYENQINCSGAAAFDAIWTVGELIGYVQKKIVGSGV